VSVSAKEAFQLASDANGGNERPVQWIKEDASQIIERGFNRGDLSVADEICSDALIEHEFSPLTLASNAIVRLRGGVCYPAAALASQLNFGWPTAACTAPALQATIVPSLWVDSTHDHHTFGPQLPCFSHSAMPSCEGMGSVPPGLQARSGSADKWLTHKVKISTCSVAIGRCIHHYKNG
jgi:hypothetical protein